MKSKVAVNTAALVIVSLTITAIVGLLVAFPLQALATPSIPIPPPGSIRIYHEQSVVTNPALLLR